MRRALLVVLALALIAVLAISLWPNLFPPTDPTANPQPAPPVADPAPAAAGAGIAAGENAAAAGRTDATQRADAVTAATLHVHGLVLPDRRHPDLSSLRVVAHAGEPTDTSAVFSGGMDGKAPPAFLLQGEPIASAAVDAQGRFDLAAPSRDLRLSIDDDLYVLPMPAIVHVPATGDATEVVLTPLLGACVQGRLFGDLAAHIGDVRLHLEPDPMTAVRDMQAYFGAVLSGTRDPQHPDGAGHFRFRGVVPGANATLTATGERAFASQHLPPLVAGETRDVALSVQAAASLRVEVVDEHGAPIAGASVRASNADAAPSVVPMLKAHNRRTDAAGTCTFDDLEPATTHVEANARERVAAEATVDLAAERTPAPLRLVLGEGGLVTGIVQDPSGAPLANARVAHMPKTSVPLLGDMSTQLGPTFLAQAAADGTPTDAEGRFRLTGLDDPGEFLVVAAHEAYGANVARDVRMGATEVVIRLTELGKVHGRVVDGEGHPAPAFTVRVVRTMFLVMRTPVRTEVVADANGAFTLVGVPPGDYTLEIAADGMSTAQSDLRVAGGDLDVGTITLQRGAFVQGRVVDEGGTPVRGALVRKRQGAMADNPMMAMFGGDANLNARTVTDGSFRLGPLPPGRLQLVASAPGFASSRSERIELAAGQELDGIQISLGHGGTIVLRLQCGPGQFPGEFLLLAQDQTTQATASPEAQSDGSFRFTNLDPGPYVVQAMPGDLMRSFGTRQWRPGKSVDLGNLFQKLADGVVSQRCAVRAGEETEVTLDLGDLTTGARWRLRVEVGDKPLDDGIVEATALAGGRMRAGMLVGGVVTFGNVEPGDYSIRVRSGLTLAPVGAPQTLNFPSGQSEHAATIRLPAGELRGRVVDAGSDKPLAHALVRLIRAADAGRDDPVGLALCDADGAFVFGGLADGTYGVVAAEALATQDGAASQTGIEVAGGRTTTTVVLRARPAATASVHVVDTAGAPLPGATVLCVDRDGHPLGTLGIAVTDASGRAWFGGLPAGAARVVGRAPGLAPAVSAVQELGPDHAVEFALPLTPGTHTTVSAVDRDGKPLVGAQLSARCDGGPWLPAMLLVERQGAGTFDLGPLGRGAWEFRCEHPAVGTLVRARTLAGEATVTVVVAP